MSGDVSDSARTDRPRVVVHARVRQGLNRVRAAFWPIMLASAAASGAWAFAHFVVGHEFPFFAPVAAWVCLGFSADREVRKVVELGVGVAIGVLFGELVVLGIGGGWWQVGLVLAVATLLARFIDRGPMLTMQAGTQAIVISSIQPGTGVTPFDRWTDALVGAAVALAVAVMLPGDPRARPRRAASDAVFEFASGLSRLADALRDADADDLETALVRLRASEPSLQEWQSVATNSADVARVNAVQRRHLPEIRRLQDASVRTDRAVRSVRVLTRRALGTPLAEHDVSAIADVVERFGSGCRVLASALSGGIDPFVAREILEEVATELDPHELGQGDWHVQSLVLLLRSPVVDMLEAAGEDPARARALLPEL
ncbi:FUSC family protein [Paraoerskovia marina]|uniref:FUSC family protein n=1 Tax=Paraoerskovia marina TaxID=545619 RepID=UPI000492AF43|nr:FUSC family protein [Paraoerskovia marina]